MRYPKTDSLTNCTFLAPQIEIPRLSVENEILGTVCETTKLLTIDRLIADGTNSVSFLFALPISKRHVLL